MIEENFSGDDGAGAGARIKVVAVLGVADQRLHAEEAVGGSAAAIF